MGRNKPDRDFEPIFLLDENVLGGSVAKVLRDSGAQLREIGGDIPRATPDAELMTIAGERGWFLLTRDYRLQRRPVEVAARKRAKLGVFILRGQSLSGAAIAEALLAALPAMIRAAKKRTRPFVYHVNVEGKLTLKEGGKRQGAYKR